MIINAMKYAEKHHEGQFRMGGLPYISHPIEVAAILERKGFTELKYVITALFHDLKEDTKATDQDILFYGGKEVLEAVNLLTKEKGYVMSDYIKKISENFLAKMVKLADRLHNLLSAIVANSSFQKKYIKETEEYYLDLAKGTVFEEDIKNALNDLKKLVK